MSKKTYTLICGIATGAESIALAICGFTIVNPAVKTAVLASIPIVVNCVIAVCGKFVKE